MPSQADLGDRAESSQRGRQDKEAQSARSEELMSSAGQLRHDLRGRRIWGSY